MAAPPYLMTTVLPAKRCRYGRASDSTDTRSKGENLCAGACAQQVQELDQQGKPMQAARPR